MKLEWRKKIPFSSLHDISTEKAAAGKLHILHIELHIVNGPRDKEPLCSWWNFELRQFFTTQTLGTFSSTRLRNTMNVLKHLWRLRQPPPVTQRAVQWVVTTPRSHWNHWWLQSLSFSNLGWLNFLKLYLLFLMSKVLIFQIKLYEEIFCI